MLSKSTEDFAKFLPMENSTNFLPPHVKAYSFRSDLFHEKMIENIAKITLNKLAYKVNNNEESEGKDSDIHLDVNKKKKGLQNEKDLINKQKINENKLKASDLDLNYREELVKKLEKRTNCKKNFSLFSFNYK